MSQQQEETYIGDGVYASFDGYAVTLWTQRQENGRNWLTLEPREFDALVKFFQKVTQQEIAS